ncbi:MAG: hypothetical protein A2527_06690 [Candidatus Lambdaproteobacteria bacterium RIFOXYD2_FULL_50_16]|uniref:YdhG-like domain-containing protein n=1 Tax=Candidatus Lambdaproteobacteria bacterium RIFOXYD2_FULL_50_16 TaxID=1817772 RepID=A0A1F6GBM5_9PROT|nr:MAG: hypothetical protein A2527_06690 [Candidatus Lambdaproteobacteria bacterium RIFOXYD2_FULL_50_16]
MNPKVDAFVAQAKRWRGELEALRQILLEFPLTEEIKWGKPCYVFNNTNLFILAETKEYCILALFNGALLKDPMGLLVRPGENTQAGRQLCFNEVSQINKLSSTIRDYIGESIEAEKAGLKLPKLGALVLVEELAQKLDKSPALKAAFHSLTPGRQRAYNLFFSAPKQSQTRLNRIEKSTAQILAGKGLNDR